MTEDSAVSCANGRDRHRQARPWAKNFTSWKDLWKSLSREASRLKSRSEWREAAFLGSVYLKGFDGLLELLGGIVLLSVSPAFILHVIQFLTQDEIVEDPHDLVANRG